MSFCGRIAKIKPVPLSLRRCSIVYFGCLSFLSIPFGACGGGTNFQSAGKANPADLFEVWHDEGAWWLQNSVTAIVQGYDGYLWLGTYHGLVRFDGITFTAFDSANAPALANGRITSLYESPNHVLWIGHETGHFSTLSNGQFYAFQPGTNWPGGVVEMLTSDEQGDVWALNDTGLLYRMRDGKTGMTPGGASAIRKATLARAHDGKVWMTSNGQVATLEQGTVVPVSFPGGEATNFHERVFPSIDGGIWILGNGRLRKWRNGIWQAEIEALPTVPGAINAVVETRFGLIAGTMREGLYVLRPGESPLHFTRADGLSHDWVRALCVDLEGNCWVGTGAGFDGFRSRKVKMLSPPDKWKGSSVRSFITQPDGSIWVGTEGAGLYHYDGRNWTSFKEADGLLNLFVWSVFETKEHELFAGTWGGGLYRLHGEKFERPDELSNINAPVTALHESSGGRLWIGTQSGLFLYQHGHLSCVAGKNVLTVPDIRAISEGTDGTLWLGMSGGGLAAFKNGEIKQFTKADGLGSDLISCLYADSDRTLWIGTSDNGLSRFKEGKFTSVGTEQGLPSKVIAHIVDDGAGYLWLGTQAGILRVNKSDLNLCADGQSASVRCLSFGRAEGLTTQICPGGFQPGACKAADGRLWFPTVKGLAVLNPRNVAANSVVPPVVIESLLVDGISPTKNNVKARIPRNEMAQNIPLLIAPGHRRFEFHYTALSFVAPDKVRFRRMLQGLERDWVDVGDRRIAEYNSLRAGDYIFKVIACNNDDLWNQAGASFAFTVRPFFWQTLWFRTAFIMAIAGLMTAGVFWVSRRRLRRALELSERQHAVERERIRIARDMHDELGASLTRITLLSQSMRGDNPGQPEVAADAQHIYTTARELTRAMDEIVWAVNPTHDTVDSLVAYLGRYAEQYLNAAGIRCHLDVPLHVPPWVLNAEARHNIFLAFKEALHNIVKHSHASETRVSVELGQAGFVLLIKDNGRGFAQNQSELISSGRSERVSSGNGLMNMRKRMETIGGTFDWETSPGSGTCIKLSISIPKWHSAGVVK